jgi:hypothetical protein
MGGHAKERTQIMKPETSEEMFAYIHEHGYMDATRAFGHEYVWELTHPEGEDHVR